MASNAQNEANTSNAQHSTGPKSLEGKRRSSQNATKHGLYAKASVLTNESQEDYASLTEAFVSRFQPQDDVEFRLVETIADCQWRLMRARYVETAMLDKQILDDAQAIEEKYTLVDEPIRLASAIQSLDKPSASAYFNSQRQESRLYRHYERAIRLLQDLQQRKKSSQNEPN